MFAKQVTFALAAISTAAVKIQLKEELDCSRSPDEMTWDEIFECEGWNGLAQLQTEAA